MNENDPAARRFFLIQFVRLLGVAFVIFGMLVAVGRTLPQWPHWIGYLLIASGLIDVFALPAIMARMWRTPE
ncbi:hypothetical protein [Novosphingobium sp.]|uniref:hypothetical protein n=1 Tax=Novosphingobium sp. TaxID=1874826 RepID=UPI002FD915BA